MPSANKAERQELHKELAGFLALGVGDKQSIVRMMAAVSKDYQPYGIAHEIDFSEMTPLFARLFAYDNKHYFVYKAISNPNKIGFLSRKQYMKYKHLQDYCDMNGISGSAFSSRMEAFLESNGTMASPYKLLKRSFKENSKNSKFLGRFFPLAEDKKTTRNEDKLIELCDTMMQLENGVEIQDASVQDCYDLDFHGSNIAGSSERCATNSCMHGKKVGHFYDAFGVHGKMVYYKGRPVGRFLLWDLPDGKKYIDRLYVRGEYMNEVLAKIDEMYTEEDGYLKYPCLRNSNAPVYMIKLSNPEFVTDNRPPQTPYIDTFGALFRDMDTGEYLLCNRSDGRVDGKYVFVSGMRSVHTNYKFTGCPYCKELYWSGETGRQGSTASQSVHKLYCAGYKPRAKELQDYLEIFRKNMPLIREASNARTRNVVFEV